MSSSVPGAASPASGDGAAPTPEEGLLERARFLAETSRLLSESLDYETTLATVARLAMPEFGAWGIVDVIEEDGTIRRLAVVHPDPAKRELVEALSDGYPPEVGDVVGAPAVVDVPRPVLVGEVTHAMLTSAARDPRHLEILRGLGFTSYMVVPMQARGRLLGCITFVGAERGRRYDATDLVLAEDVAARGAMAIDNARLYRAAERARGEAERARDAAMAFGVRAHASELSKTDFLSTMSHELRTPLNAVLGYADLLSAGVAGGLTPQQERYLDRQREATRHLLGLVNDVLEVAKAEADELPVARDALSLRAALRAVFPLVQPQADARGVRITVDWARTRQAPGPIRYVGDARRVEQILVNLVGNAIKFTPRDGRVTLALVRHDGALASVPDGGSAWVGVRVADTGIGIAPEDHARVFEPFVQVAHGTTRPAGGTGLGLTISRRLARLMGGDVTIESVAGEGSVFTLWLPAPASEAAHRASHDTPAERRGAARLATGLSAIGEALLREVDDIVVRYADRVRVDPLIPAARAAPWTEVGNHTATLLADIAQAPAVVEDAHGDGTDLMRIGEDIREVVSSRHAQRRAQLGWSRPGFERDCDILSEEVEHAVRRCAPAEAADAVDDALSIIHRLLEEARRIGRLAFDREAALVARGPQPELA